MSNGARKRRIAQRVYKDLQDPEGALRREQGRQRNRARRAKEKERRRREQIEEYRRAREAGRLKEYNLRKHWRKQALSEEEIDAKLQEFEAGLGRFRERIKRKSGDDQSE